MSTYVANTISPVVLPWNYFSGAAILPAITPEVSAALAYSQAPLNAALPFLDNFATFNAAQSSTFVANYSSAAIVLSNLSAQTSVLYQNGVAFPPPSDNVATQVKFTEQHVLNMTVTSVPGATTFTLQFSASGIPYSYNLRTITSGDPLQTPNLVLGAIITQYKNNVTGAPEVIKGVFTVASPEGTASLSKGQLVTGTLTTADSIIFGQGDMLEVQIVWSGIFTKDLVYQFNGNSIVTF